LNPINVFYQLFLAEKNGGMNSVRFVSGTKNLIWLRWFGVCTFDLSLPSGGISDVVVFRPVRTAGVFSFRFPQAGQRQLAVRIPPATAISSVPV